MYRNIINDFANWYDQTKRKILYVKGAKGVGKTWAVRDFATAFFKQQCYINLAEDSACQDAIAGDSNLDLLLSQRFPFGDASDCILSLTRYRQCRTARNFSMLSARIIQITPSV